MLVSIRAFSNQSVFACGDFGYVRRFDGQEWSLRQLDTPSPLQAIDGVAENDLWVGGAGGFLAHYDGFEWTQTASSTTGDISDFHVVTENEIYASTRQGDLIFYDGDKWERVLTPSRAQFNSVSVGQDRIWLAGDAAVVMVFDPYEEECVRNGDVTGDGQVTAGDAQLAFLIVLGLYEPDPVEACAADCNGDGQVTAADAQSIFLTALGVAYCFDDLYMVRSGFAAESGAIEYSIL
jgi:hypothetical protein